MPYDLPLEHARTAKKYIYYLIIDLSKIVQITFSDHRTPTNIFANHVIQTYLLRAATEYTTRALQFRVGVGESREKNFRTAISRKLLTNTIYCYNNITPSSSSYTNPVWLNRFVFCRRFYTHAHIIYMYVCIYACVRVYLYIYLY